MDGALDVGAGAFHSLAVKDGRVWAWGWNAFGQLGIGSTVDRPLAVQVPGLSRVTAVAGGAGHSLAVTDDGSVWAWGLNHVGQVGTGTTTDSLVPVRVVGPTKVIAVAAGLYHSLALSSDGVVWAWGFNNVGQLGTGDPKLYDPIPRPVITETPSTSIAAGAFHSVSLGAYGTVTAWGLNHVGQLGDGSTQHRTKPVHVGSLIAIRSITAGWFHTFAVGGDGATWAWGWNGFGQLGNGTMTDALSPVAIAGVQPSLITAGATHSVAMTPRGE